MKILFCSLKNEYGDPSRGVSFEYKHFFNALEKMDGIEVEYFATDAGLNLKTREEVNRRLVAQVEQTKPDLLFCFLFTEELKKETISYITQKTSTKTFNWFGDDHWRFPIYSRFWAPLFSFVSTTDSLAFKKYKSAGINNVVKTQWGVNHHLFQPQDKSADNRNYKITFFGQNYGSRGKYIDSLQKAGLPAEGVGRGWGSNRTVGGQEMLNVYSFSKINLNFTETPYMGLEKKLNLLAKMFVKKEFGQYKFNAHNLVDNFRAAVGTQRRTIKARTFEVTACGGFLLTGKPDDDLGEYLEIGKEAVVFKNEDELIEKCKYYLYHNQEREAIAQAGYIRTLKDHTYERRFLEIFKQLGF